MKKYLIATAFLGLSLTAEAQVINFSEGGQLMFRKSPEFEEASISGSKYFNENFSQARVNQGSENFLIRYNAYSDIMEYKDGNDLLELIKDKNIYFEFANGEVYELLTYDIKETTVSRYHQILSDKNNIKISKFKSIKLNAAREAINSYDIGNPASYSPNKEVYYITVNNQTTEFDGKRKSAESLFPSKSVAIKKFYKDNKIKTNDDDMIKLGNFLATL